MHIRHFCFLFAFVPFALLSQQTETPRSRPVLDVPAIVLRSERMQFVVYRSGGPTINGTLLNKKIVVRNVHREDLEAAAKKLQEGKPVPQEFRDLAFGDALAEFYVGNVCVLRLDPWRDRILCSSKDGSVDLFFGKDGVQEVETVFNGFIGTLVDSDGNR